MAGTYFEILRPGYSTLTTHDLPYATGTGETGVQVFNPLSARPLIEGEWLQYASSTTGWVATRGGNNSQATPGTPDGEGTVMAWPHWLERGRFDAQTRQYAHLLKGPVGFTFRTRVCDSTGLAAGDLVSVWDIDLGDGVIRRGLAKASTSPLAPVWAVGVVERVFGTNDIAVFFQPTYIP